MKHIGMGMALMLSLVVMLVVLPFSKLPPLHTFEARYGDLLMTYLAKKTPPSENIIVVKITEDTLATLPYRSPLDRELLADVVEKILSANPKGIGIDILLDQPSEKAKDDRLFALLEKNSDKVFVVFAEKEDGLSDGQFAYQTKVLENASKSIAVLPKDGSDGIVRYFLEARPYGNKMMPSLAHAMAGTKPDQLSNDQSRIVYQHKEDGRPRDFPTYPAHAVKVLPPAWFADKYVFIGVDLPFIDRHRTPFSSSLGEIDGAMPGVFIHAHILDQVLSGVRINEIKSFSAMVLMWIGGIIGLLVVRIRQSIWLRVAVLFSCIAGCVGLSLIAFELKLLLAPTIAIITTMSLSAILGSAILWQSDRSEKRFVRDAWSHYVSPDVVDDMISHPEKMKLGGEKMDVSFIFTDIAGFTTMSENMPVEQLSVVLNNYLDRVSDEFVKAGATLDKFVGDAVIGFIGAPFPDEDHPNKAVKLAIAINNVCCEYQAELAKSGFKFGHTRIGVHSGQAIVGNFGGSNFFDYTALGDTVNTAARLEGANKVFGSYVCVSGATAKRATDHEFRPMGQIILAGKTKPVEALEPIGAILVKAPPTGVYHNAYMGLDKDPISSMQAFKSLEKEYPDDYLVKYHLGRLKNGLSSTSIDLTGGSIK